MLAAPEGSDRDYSTDRYTRYRESDQVRFPVLRTDDRVHPKTVVYGFQIDETAIAFAEESLESGQPLVHVANDRELTVTMNDDGSVSLVTSDGESFVPVRLFWFAWYTFYPNTVLVSD